MPTDLSPELRAAAHRVADAAIEREARLLQRVAALEDRLDALVAALEAASTRESY